MALTFKALPGVNTSLAEEDPSRYFLPSYVASKGWAGVWLDVDDVQWDVVEELLGDSYDLTAPNRLRRAR